LVRYSGKNEEWNENWKERNEAYYTHWTRGKPENQIQLAFRNHWELFQHFMNSPLHSNGNRSLEVGCGRGSLSAYFSDAGYEATLLDLSPEVIEIAEKIFTQNNLQATFKVGDAYNLAIDDKSFDVVFSIGVFEHFDEIETPIREQVRVLDSGGLFIAYVVPEYSQNIQQKFEWINNLLKGYAGAASFESGQHAKSEVFRSDHGSSHYLPVLEKMGLINLQAAGVYPLPMISHSIDFPFSLMPLDSEKHLVNHLESMLDSNKGYPHRWMCEEGYGNAFVVWGYKP